jgi:hypothetical protein
LVRFRQDTNCGTVDSSREKNPNGRIKSRALAHTRANMRSVKTCKKEGCKLITHTRANMRSVKTCNKAVMQIDEPAESKQPVEGYAVENAEYNIQNRRVNN